jgi:ABC-2 type transport system ATP-binding protein
MHAGQVLAKGRPADITEKAKGCCFLMRDAKGMAARSLQARLFSLPGVVDAVPEAGRVRVVRKSAEDERPLEVEGTKLEIEAVKPRFEDAFMMLFNEATGDERRESRTEGSSQHPASAETIVEVRDLVRTFGDFTAVDHVSFGVKRGEVYGLLGPNGAGKSTTFKMLCGLLPASSGTLQVAGANLLTAGAKARQRLGYVAQKFSLYAQLTVDENLEFFSSAYGLRGRAKRDRINTLKEQFELGQFSGLPSGQLPGGFKQRLALAAALLHEPDILFLDEATSGADPLARRQFWGRTAIGSSFWTQARTLQKAPPSKSGHTQRARKTTPRPWSKHSSRSLRKSGRSPRRAPHERSGTKWPGLGTQAYTRAGAQGSLAAPA